MPTTEPTAPATPPAMIFVNLPVTDLPRSVAFYEALGGRREPRFSNDAAAMITLSEAIRVMLLTHGFYAGFTRKRIPDAHESAQVLLALSAAGRAEVDRLVEAARGAGGVADPGPAQDHDHMYGRSFEDPDGHTWEAVWMDPAFAGAGDA